MCTGFVAEDSASGELIGCAFASFLAAEAMMPPPWPTSKPVRYYMSNLAVLPEHRRRGAALALLKACELLGGCSLDHPYVPAALRFGSLCTHMYPADHRLPPTESC